MSFYGSTSGYEEQRDDDDLDPEYNQQQTTTLPPSTAVKEPTTKVVLDSFAISEPQQGEKQQSLIYGDYLICTNFVGGF